ncbi:hypothetical protein OAN307_c13100 [Octadecabacter antarcticus 307]|uniref:SF3 helicase domain-containing protein n=1 Tax=Octadecabacter antarcticus 307 TaxID=391626 RepID=M9R5G2_9RHOB|nr:primase-helicase family protein [Octadecabacter antarcticus]AGI67003.1 hypothetical protein OAN307_c13100 [Octadecabacter antarcticus 307]
MMNDDNETQDHPVPAETKGSIEWHEDDDLPVSADAKAYLDKHDKRFQQGLGNYPHNSGGAQFVRLGNDGKSYVASVPEVLQTVSSWYVKKDNKFHDVDNLAVKYTSHDVKQVVVQRIKELFPTFYLNSNGWADFFKVLLDPPVNVLDPEQTIPVWSGQTASFPSNKQKVLFKKGVAVINIWETPAYREVLGINAKAFWDFLSYVIPVENERETLINWLAWVLQNEGKKPKWAILLYSQKQGTGKTTLTDVCKALFGPANTGKTNGVSKLVGRFNKEVLDNKLVIVEEVEVKKGSTDANRIKTLITEDSTMVEAKFMPSHDQIIHCAFVMTTNHLPLWLEEADRRFFILNFDHEGYNNGGKDYGRFSKLVGAVYDLISTDKGIKGIYDDLMARDVKSFNAMSLDVANNSTSIMTKLRDLSPDVVKQQVKELLEEKSIVFVPVSLAGKVIDLFAHREANSQTHLFSDLGWEKKKFAWNSGGQKWAWFKPSPFPPGNGKVWDGGNYARMSDQVNKVENLIDPQGNNDSRSALSQSYDDDEPTTPVVKRVEVL